MALKRLGLGLLTLLVVSIIIFSAVEMLPGDLAQEILGQAATPETVAAFRKELGLDKPPVERYFDWLGGAVQGDFGKSLASKRLISELMATRLGNTLFLASFAAVLAVPISIVLGLLAALYRNTWFDRMINVVTLSSISFPEFFVAYILILMLAVGYPFDLAWVLLIFGIWLLAEGYGSVKNALKIGKAPILPAFFAIAGIALIVNFFLGWWTPQMQGITAYPSISNIAPGTPFWERVDRSFLPALTLTLVVTAHMMRMTRAAIINLLASPYIEMARLKGMSPWRVIVTHALPNALAPIINVVAINLAYLITGVVVVEVVFVYPGVGQLMVDSVTKRDVTVVQACCLIFAATYILLNLLADVLAIATNPRLLHPK
jgi:peptide/nickel transport system permease protein